tara:strand:- start:378 stop:530 length:153 start_codon:yes stop_codon:yes gene_type:complete
MSKENTGSKLQNLTKAEDAIKEKHGPHEKKDADKDSDQAKTDMQSEGGKT